MNRATVKTKRERNNMSFSIYKIFNTLGIFTPLTKCLIQCFAKKLVKYREKIYSLANSKTYMYNLEIFIWKKLLKDQYKIENVQNWFSFYKIFDKTYSRKFTAK